MVVTRADVAKRAGVSPAVVSYVMNNGPRPVAAGTRKRVENAIRELDYRPNVFASVLNGSMSLSVGFISDGNANPFFAELHDALVDSFFQRGHSLLVGIADGDLVRTEEYVRSFVDRRTDGLVLTNLAAPSIREVVSHLRFPVVVIDALDHIEGISTIHLDNVQAAQTCVHHLQEHGHSRIGVIAGPSNALVALDRAHGWAEAQRSKGYPAGPELLTFAEFSMRDGYNAAFSLLSTNRHHKRRDDAPTALFVASDVQAIGAMAAVRDLGLDVPRDVAIVSIDGTDPSGFTSPKLTTLRQSVEDISSWVVEELLSRINDPRKVPTSEILSGNLVIGGSCGCNGGNAVDI